MENFVNSLSALAKLINQNHDLLLKEELESMVNTDNATEKDIYKIATKLLDYSIKNNSFMSNKPYFDQLLGDNLPLSLDTLSEISNILSVLKGDNLDYYYSGINLLDTLVYTPNELCILINEKDIDTLFTDLYQDGTDIIDTRPVGSLNVNGNISGSKLVNPYCVVGNEFTITFRPFKRSKQGDMYITDYYTKDKSIWVDIEHLTSSDLYFILDDASRKEKPESLYCVSSKRATKESLISMSNLSNKIDKEKLKIVEQIYSRCNYPLEIKEADQNGLRKII